MKNKNTNGLGSAAVATAVVLLMMSGCASTSKTGKGAAIGAGAGAAIGAAAGGWKGAAIGAVGGGALGAGVGDYLEKRQEELAKVAPTEKTKEGLRITLKNDLLFGFDQASLKSDAQSQLSELAEILKKYPDDRLRVLGYTDDVGATQYNQKLSERRADSVKEYLLEKGVSNERITAVGKGELAPQAKNDAARAKSRKVNILIEDPHVKAANEEQSRSKS